MSSWFIGAGKIEDVYAVMDVMKCEPIEGDLEGCNAAMVYLMEHGRFRLPAVMVTYPSMFVDGGGMVGLEEPRVKFEANGCTLETYVRHLPFVLEVLRGLKESKKFPGCVAFCGFCRRYVISLATRDAAVVELERLVRETEAERQREEMKLQHAIQEAGNVVSLRKCTCQSGELYVKCCGKYVETGEHQAAREAIEETLERKDEEGPAR